MLSLYNSIFGKKEDKKSTSNIIKRQNILGNYNMLKTMLQKLHLFNKSVYNITSNNIENATLDDLIKQFHFHIEYIYSIISSLKYHKNDQKVLDKYKDFKELLSILIQISNTYIDVLEKNCNIFIMNEYFHEILNTNDSCCTVYRRVTIKSLCIELIETMSNECIIKDITKSNMYYMLFELYKYHLEQIPYTKDNTIYLKCIEIYNYYINNLKLNEVITDHDVYTEFVTKMQIVLHELKIINF